HAIRFLRSFLSSRPRTQEFQNQWDSLRPAIGTRAATQFEIEFSIGAIDERFTYEIAIPASGTTELLDYERLSLGDVCLFHQERRIWAVVPEIAPLPDAGTSAISRLPALTYAVMAYAALTTGLGCYAFSDDVLRSKKTDDLTNRGPGLND